MSNPAIFKLSIIIVSYNTCEITRDCLNSIFNSTFRDSFEVIVVDNDSKDDSVEMIQSEFPQCKLICNSSNNLFSKANNQGVSIANGEYILLLNSDTIVQDDNIQKLLDFFDKCAENVICVGPKILNKDNTLQSCGFPEWGSIFQHVCKLFHLNNLPIFRHISPTMIHNPEITHRVGWVSGSCMLIRRSLYVKIGGLNENLIFYGEEPEFGFRAKKYGYDTYYFSEASIIHLGGVSTESRAKKPFEKDIDEYQHLITETVGDRRAAYITWWTISALRIKRIFHPNKSFFNKKIAHEINVLNYFRNKSKK